MYQAFQLTDASAETHPNPYFALGSRKLKPDQITVSTQKLIVILEPQALASASPTYKHKI